MEQTRSSRAPRTLQPIMDLADGRYGKTDIERPCSWLNQPTEFPRRPNANLQDSRPGLRRTTARLGSTGVEMSGEMDFRNPLALKLSETQCPIAISALETKTNRHILDTIKDIAAKCSRRPVAVLILPGLFAPSQINPSHLIVARRKMNTTKKTAKNRNGSAEMEKSS